jgi:hypothetical protein
MTAPRTRTEPEAGSPGARAELEERFQKLAAVWRRDVAFLSSITKITQHPAYQEIISMGEAVVPLLLRELEQGPEDWFVALHAITGAAPIPPEDRGYMDRMAAAWLRWGKEHGYTW